MGSNLDEFEPVLANLTFFGSSLVSGTVFNAKFPSNLLFFIIAVQRI